MILQVQEVSDRDKVESVSAHSLHRMYGGPVGIARHRDTGAAALAQVRTLDLHTPVPRVERDHRLQRVVVENLHQMEERAPRPGAGIEVLLPGVRVRLARGVVGAAELVALAWGVEVVGVEVLRAVSGEGELVAIGDVDVGEVAGAGGFEDAWRGVRGPRS